MFLITKVKAKCGFHPESYLLSQNKISMKTVYVHVYLLGSNERRITISSGHCIH